MVARRRNWKGHGSSSTTACPSNTHIHGLANDTVANEPDFADVCGDISTKLTTRGPNEHRPCCPLRTVRHSRAPRSEFARAGMELPDLPSWTRRLLARHLDIKARRFNLTSLTRHFGIPRTTTTTPSPMRLPHPPCLSHSCVKLATQGHSVFGTSQHLPPPTTGGTRGLRRRQRFVRYRDAGSSFIYIERPIRHSATHTKMVSRPSAAARAQVNRRCTQMRPVALPPADGTLRTTPRRARGSRSSTGGRTGWHLGSEDSVSANTVLGAICRLCARYLTTRNEAGRLLRDARRSLRETPAFARSGSGEQMRALTVERTAPAPPTRGSSGWQVLAREKQLHPVNRQMDATRRAWTPPPATRPASARNGCASMYECWKEKQADTTSVVDAAVASIWLILASLWQTPPDRRHPRGTVPGGTGKFPAGTSQRFEPIVPGSTWMTTEHASRRGCGGSETTTGKRRYRACVRNRQVGKHPTVHEAAEG